jgi:hypothetical protein
MAITAKVIQTSSLADMVTQANAYLATLVNPKINAWTLAIADLPTRIGIEVRLLLETDTGGAALATPFLLDLVSAQNSPAFQTAVQAYLDAYNPTQFVSGPKLLWAPTDESVNSTPLVAAFMRNTTAGASANYLIKA